MHKHARMYTYSQRKYAPDGCGAALEVTTQLNICVHAQAHTHTLKRHQNTHMHTRTHAQANTHAYSTHTHMQWASINLLLG